MKTFYKKCREYFSRYALSIAAGIACVVIVGEIIYRLTKILWLPAVASTILDPAAFYSVAYLQNRKNQNLKSLAMEYLPAGVLNNFFRPFLLYWSAKMLNNVMAGNLIGMILDYAIFIGLCVISYELTRKIWPHWFARQSA